MSVNTIERIFWDLGNEPERISAYLADPEAYLAPFPLTDAERAMIRKMDVKALDAHGVSPMLSLLIFQKLNGGNDLLIFDYLRQLNDGRMINRMRLPAPVFAMMPAFLGVVKFWNAARRRLRFG